MHFTTVGNKNQSTEAEVEKYILMAVKSVQASR
jgi:hypothetical protein